MKIGVIGLGIIGNVHIDVLKKSGMEIAAVCDCDAGVMDLMCTKHGINPQKFTDYKQMIKSDIIDAVHVCTPHYLHAEMVIFALENNINVLCEKPLCISHSEIDEILAAEKKSKAALGVIHQNRYNPENSYIKDFLENKKVRAAHGSVVWTRDKAYYDSAEWRGKIKTEGGGVLINQALHTLDLLQWMCGMPDFTVAQTSNFSLKNVIEVEDTVSAAYGGDSNFVFFATNASKTGFPVTITIQTDKETINIHNNTAVINGETVNFPPVAAQNWKNCYGNGHFALFKDFYECIKSGKKFKLDGSEGAKVVRLILAAYKSNGEKTKII